MVWPQNPSLLYFDCYPNDMTVQSLFIVMWAVIITRSKAIIPDTNKMRWVIWSKIRFYKVLVISKTRDYVAITYQVKVFQNGWSDVFATSIGRASCNKNSVAFKLNSLWSLSSTISFTRLKQLTSSCCWKTDHPLPPLIIHFLWFLLQTFHYFVFCNSSCVI